MKTALYPRAMFINSRARVYLLWALLCGIGFVWTHYYQMRQINIVWTVISIIGLGYMFKVMPMRVSRMQSILASWTIPIIIGMAFSAYAFLFDDLRFLIQYLGTFWLVVMAVGYIWNGLVDRPLFWYAFAALINVLAALATYYIEPFLLSQYLVAAIVSVWSLLYLWLFRAS